MANRDVWSQINFLILSYADAVDRADVEALTALFAEDATFDHGPDWIQKDRKEIGEFFRARFPALAHTTHHFGAPMISPTTTPHVFDCVTYLFSIHQLKDGTIAKVHGRYNDVIRCTPQESTFLKRKLIVHIVEGSSRAYNYLERKSLV